MPYISSASESGVIATLQGEIASGVTNGSLYLVRLSSRSSYTALPRQSKPRHETKSVAPPPIRLFKCVQPIAERVARVNLRRYTELDNDENARSRMLATLHSGFIP